MENNTPNKEDIAAFIGQMQSTMGWQIFDKWLQERLNLYIDKIMITLDQRTAGQVDMIKEINQQLKDYVSFR